MILSQGEKEKGVIQMKKKFFWVMKKTITGIADLSSETTSVFGLYQPNIPKTLIKKKRTK